MHAWAGDEFGDIGVVYVAVEISVAGDAAGFPDFSDAKFASVVDADRPHLVVRGVEAVFAQRRRERRRTERGGKAAPGAGDEAGRATGVGGYGELPVGGAGVEVEEAQVVFHDVAAESSVAIGDESHGRARRWRNPRRRIVR